MAKVNASQYTDKWARRTSAATPDYKAGIERVNRHPGEAAVEQAERMLNSFIEAIQSGKWAREVTRGSLSDWKKAASEKGGARISAGVEGARAKVQARAAELLAAVEATQAEIAGMPQDSFEARLERMNAWARGMRSRAPKRQG